jgi:hypothetical protein
VYPLGNARNSLRPKDLAVLPSRGDSMLRSGWAAFPLCNTYAFAPALRSHPATSERVSMLLRPGDHHPMGRCPVDNACMVKQMRIGLPIN